MQFLLFPVSLRLSLSLSLSLHFSFYWWFANFACVLDIEQKSNFLLSFWPFNNYFREQKLLTKCGQRLMSFRQRVIGCESHCWTSAFTLGFWRNKLNLDHIIYRINGRNIYADDLNYNENFSKVNNDWANDKIERAFAPKDILLRS